MNIADRHRLSMRYSLYPSSIHLITWRCAAMEMHQMTLHTPVLALLHVFLVLQQEKTKNRNAVVLVTMGFVIMIKSLWQKDSLLCSRFGFTRRFEQVVGVLHSQSTQGSRDNEVSSRDDSGPPDILVNSFLLLGSEVLLRSDEFVGSGVPWQLEVSSRVVRLQVSCCDAHML